MFVMSKLGGLFSKALPPALSPPAAPLLRPSGKYMRGGRGVTFAGWKPALQEAQDDIGEAWDDAAAWVKDLLHNSGWLAGTMEQCVANTVGTGLQLKALPENETFGMTPVEASDWAKTVERRFELWATVLLVDFSAVQNWRSHQPLHNQNRHFGLTLEMVYFSATIWMRSPHPD